jgi:hypothetical protein
MVEQVFTMKSEVVAWPSVMRDDDLVQSADPKNLRKTALHNFRTFV